MSQDTSLVVAPSDCGAGFTAGFRIDGQAFTVVDRKDQAIVYPDQITAHSVATFWQEIEKRNAVTEAEYLERQTKREERKAQLKAKWAGGSEEDTDTPVADPDAPQVAPKIPRRRKPKAGKKTA